jgi:hypothetical protein
MDSTTVSLSFSRAALGRVMRGGRALAHVYALRVDSAAGSFVARYFVPVAWSGPEIDELRAGFLNAGAVDISLNDRDVVTAGRVSAAGMGMHHYAALERARWWVAGGAKGEWVEGL